MHAQTMDTRVLCECVSGVVCRARASKRDREQGTRQRHRGTHARVCPHCITPPPFAHSFSNFYLPSLSSTCGHPQRSVQLPTPTLSPPFSSYPGLVPSLHPPSPPPCMHFPTSFVATAATKAKRTGVRGEDRVCEETVRVAEAARGHALMCRCGGSERLGN